MVMGFGYFPDYQGKNALKDLYLKTFGYPYPSRRNEARLVFKLLEPKKGEKILDIGHGDGIWTNELAKQGFDITGLDLSRHDFVKAKIRAKKMKFKTKFVLADAQKMPFQDNEFDKIFSICTFEHIRNDEAAFKECYRVLQPKGIFVLSVPSQKILTAIKIAIKFPPILKKILFNSLIQKSPTTEEWRKNFDHKFKHFRNYNLEELKRRVQKIGFKIEKILYNVGFWGTIPHSLIHTLKIFEWKKSTKKDYSFKNELIFALAFPLFYPLYRLDDLFSNKKGSAIILKLRKK